MASWQQVPQGTQITRSLGLGDYLQDVLSFLRGLGIVRIALRDQIYTSHIYL